MNWQNRQAVSTHLAAAEQVCARKGAQFTKLRRAVLSLILEAERPCTAYQLLDRLRQTHKGAVPPTIYRALDFLMEHRLIHKLERLNAFVACVHAEHAPDAVQFLICRKCGVVAELEDRAVSRALHDAAKRKGFHSSVVIVELEGTCAACSLSSTRTAE